MTEEQRKEPRIKIPLNVSLKYSDEGQLFAVTRDISDRGIFLLLDQENVPKIGDVVRVQVQNMGGGEEAPWVRMKVVRKESVGLGLMILDE